MTADIKKWAEEGGRERAEKYEKRKEDDSFYREMDNDQLLEEVSRKFPGCPDDMCFACLDNDTLINELRRRMEEK